MSKLNDLIIKLCPDGVPYRKLGEVAEIKRGRRLTKKQLSDVELPGTFPVFHGGLQPIGYYSEKNRQANTVMITNVGAAGTVLFSERDFWSSDGCFCLLELKALNPRFAYYYLKEHEHKLKQRVRVAGIPTLDADVLKRFEIPVPPLPVQEEIVRILDAFTELEAELEAELADRIEQYEYCQNRLLSQKNLERMDGKPVETKPMWAITTWDKKFNGVDKKKQPAINKHHYYLAKELEPLIVPDGDIKVLTTSPSDLYTTVELAKGNIKDGEIVAIPWGGNAIVQYYNGKYITSDNRIAIVNDEKQLNCKFLFYVLKNREKELAKYYRGAGIKHPDMFKVLHMEIPVPSLATQERIVDILDRFDTLTTSLTDGIPAEIAMRREQYEYFRSRLLNFSRLPDDTVSDGE